MNLGIYFVIKEFKFIIEIECYGNANLKLHQFLQWSTGLYFPKTYFFITIPHSQ